MGEAVFTRLLRELGLRAQVASRGLRAPVGALPHRYAIEIASAHGAPIDAAKRATALTLPELHAATAVFVMENSHRNEILQRFPTASGKTFLLGQWQDCPIADPINLPREHFETAWRAIEAGSRSWLEQFGKAGLLPKSEAP